MDYVFKLFTIFFLRLKDDSHDESDFDDDSDYSDLP